MGEVIVRHAYYADDKLVLTSIWSYCFAQAGEVDISVRVDVDDSLPPLPRVGACLQLTETPDKVAWLGLGRMKITLIAS